ncbi:MAG: hypothetical protein IPJ76_12140 [Flavobacteriales bacterium]|nr:MAG: hypothetical protein IPJ76_12140 [Flavobacteriales bacterium]
MDQQQEESLLGRILTNQWLALFVFAKEIVEGVAWIVGEVAPWIGGHIPKLNTPHVDWIDLLSKGVIAALIFMLQRMLKLMRAENKSFRATQELWRSQQEAWHVRQRKLEKVERWLSTFSDFRDAKNSGKPLDMTFYAQQRLDYWVLAVRACLRLKVVATREEAESLMEEHFGISRTILEEWAAGQNPGDMLHRDAAQHP